MAEQMAVKASDRVKFYKNKNGATVGSCDRKVFEVEGLYFKDIDGSGEFKDFDDWRIQLRQTVRSYNDNLDVIFNMVEEEPYLKLKINLITKEDLNRLKHSQAKPLYSDEGEI